MLFHFSSGDKEKPKPKRNSDISMTCQEVKCKKAATMKCNNETCQKTNRSYRCKECNIKIHSKKSNMKEDGKFSIGFNPTIFQSRKR